MPSDKQFYYAKYRDLLPEIKYYMRLKLTPLVYIHEHYVRQQLCRALARWTCHAQLDDMAARQRELSTRLEKIGVWLIQSQVSGQFALACRHLCRIHRFRALATGFLRWKQQVVQYALIVARAPMYMDWILTPQPKDRPAIALLQLKGRGLVQLQRKHLIQHQRRQFRRWRQATLGHRWLHKRLSEWKERLRLHRWREWVRVQRQVKARHTQIEVHLEAFRTRRCIHTWARIRYDAHVDRVLQSVSNVGCRRTTKLAVFIRTKRATILSVVRRMQVCSVRQGFLQWRLHSVTVSHQTQLARVEADAGRVYGAKATIRMWQLALLKRKRRAFHHLRAVKLHTKQGDAHRDRMLLWASWAQWRQYRHVAELERRNSAHDLKWTNFQRLHVWFRKWTRLRVVTKDIQARVLRQWRLHLHHRNVQTSHQVARRRCGHSFQQWTRWVHGQRRQRLVELGVVCGVNVDVNRRTMQWLATRHCFATWKSQGQVSEGLMHRMWGHHARRFLRQSLFQRWKQATMAARQRALVEDGASMQKLVSAVTHRVQRHASRDKCRHLFQVWRTAAIDRRNANRVLQRVITTLRSGNLVRSFSHWRSWTKRSTACLRLFAMAMQRTMLSVFRVWCAKIDLQKQLRVVAARWTHQSTTTCLWNVWRPWAVRARMRQHLARQCKRLRNQTQQRVAHNQWTVWRSAFVAIARQHETHRHVLRAAWSAWTYRLHEYSAQRRLLHRLTTNLYVSRLRRAMQIWMHTLLFHVAAAETRLLETRLTERDHRVRELLTDQATRCRQLEQLVADRHTMMQLVDESRHKLHQFKRVLTENQVCVEYVGGGRANGSAPQELKRVVDQTSRLENQIEQLRGVLGMLSSVRASHGMCRAMPPVGTHARTSRSGKRTATSRERAPRHRDARAVE
ncbi:hypothetical protein, variant [Aphanomyces invadans]|uniref:Uncharacterized protein n=1 Tax=Aphanomyces invadans TaxID=157072 RepID=A0A024TH07_9STRA|nr:hypothetical protein, variant [Aphanomyces invadans]ETV93410.1 hypothetical protein, variant [Aphanomyces invadans]|eukprot:XP_008878046.1 hypothetical protein, variant [Aphanomyces invadans]